MRLDSIAILADELAAGRVRATELVERAVRIAEQEVPSAIEFMIAHAHARAEASDLRRAGGRSLGPLDGIPFAVKANIDLAGQVTTSGLATPVHGWWPPAERDAHVVTQLVEAGAIPVLATTMAPMAMGSVTISPGHGPCRNPRDDRRHAGGSSGGSGAVVGAGAVPFALGTDTMGSVRIPADYCRVTGWIPTPGLVDQAGMVPLCTELDRLGILCADPRDLPVLIGLVSSGSVAAPMAAARVRALDVGTLIDPPAREAVRHAVAALAQAGHVRVDERGLEIDLGNLRRRAFLLVEAQASVTFADARARGAVPEAMTGLLDYGSAATPEAFERSHLALAQTRAVARQLLDDAEILVLPTTPGGAPLLDEDPSGAADLTAWVNVAGLPAVSTPVGERSVQLVGRPGSDLLLAQAAASVFVVAESGRTPLEEG